MTGDGSGGGLSPGPRRLRLPIPTSIITGALASGKTTFIASLLHSKPPEELWAVLVNEFGAAGLDAALLEGGAAVPSGAAAAQRGAQPLGDRGVHVRQLAGGCLCCALSSVTATAIAQLLRKVKPDRLLIEPSGLAHPAALLEMLQGGHLASALALQPVICLVDATQFGGGASSPAACQGSQLLQDQISTAHVLVGSKADLCDTPTLAAFHRWERQLLPPKALVATAACGQLQGASLSELLTWSQAPAHIAPGSVAIQQGGTAQQGAPAPPSRQQEQQLLLPARRVRRLPAGQPWLSSSSAGNEAGGIGAGDAAAALDEPLRKEVRDDSGAFTACGWIFHHDCVFSRERLQALLGALLPHILRLKGVFRVAPDLWLAVSAAPSPAHVAAAVSGPSPGAAAGNLADGNGSSRDSSSSSGGATDGSLVQQGASQPVPIELREVAYMRDSRVEVILDTVAAATRAAAGAAAAAAAACGAGTGPGDLDSQLAALSLAGKSDVSSSGEDSRAGVLVTALGRAAAGDWSALETALLATLEATAAKPSN